MGVYERSQKQQAPWKKVPNANNMHESLPARVKSTVASEVAKASAVVSSSPSTAGQATQAVCEAKPIAEGRSQASMHN